MGYDLSDARLQAIAYSLGIDRATSSMTQAEKAQLRYYAIMTQVTSAQGDMARTLSAPSNQLRIFQAQLTMVGRAIGNIFIPALNAILPVAIAVMQAIRGVATAIASLFGYSLPEVSYTAGLDSVTDSANNAAGGLGNAAGAAKKLKNYLMGFDELNVIPDQSGGGGGGGSGGAGGGIMSGFDFELPEYDFLADAVESNVDRIYKKIEPVVTWITDNLNTIGTLALSIGGALLSWKLSSAAISSLSNGLTLISGIQAVAATLATLGITVGLVYKFDTTFLETGDATSLIGDGLSTLLGSAIAGGTVKKLIGKVAGASAGNAAGVYTAGITLLISAATSIVATYKDAYLSAEWDSNTWWMQLVTAIKGALGGAAIGFQLGGLPGAGVGALIGLVATVAVSVSATLDGIDKGMITKRVQWGDVHATAEEIRGIAESMFAVDIEPIISVGEAQVQNVTKAKDNLQTTLDSFGADLNLILLGVDTSPEALSAMGVQATTLINDLTTLIAERQQAVSVVMTVVPALDGEGNDISGDITAAIGLSSTMLTDGVTAMGEELGKLLSEGMTDGFSQEETLRITELLGSMSRIAEAVATGEAQVDFESKTHGLNLSDLDKESVLGVVDEYIAMEDELRKSLEESAWMAKSTAQGNLAGLQTYLAEVGDTLSPEQYTAVEAEIATLEAWLADWSLEKSVNAKLTEITAPMRAQFAKFFDDTFGSVVADNTEFGAAWAKEWVDSLGGNIDSPESMRTLATNMENMIDSALYTALGEENYSVAISMADSLGFTDWDLLGTELQTSLYNTLVEAVGGEKTIALFESLGYSLPDAIQTGIDNAGGVDAPTIDAPDASAISTAVEDAVAAAETTATDKFGNIEVTANSTAKVIQGLDSDTLPILQNLVNDSETAYAEVQNAWSGTEAWFKNNVADPMSNGFSNNNWKQAGAKAASGIKAGLKSVKMPAIKVDWSITSKSFEMFGQNTVIKVPIPNLKFYAGGGFPDSGELFMANENGASELVGRIGNRSAVANQDQIGDAIFQYMDAHAEENGMDEERLAAAMVSAMRSAGIGSVYIDGRRITQAINRESQRSGKPALNY